MRSGSGVFSATGISLWPAEEDAAMVVTVFLLFNDSDNVSDIFLFELKLERHNSGCCFRFGDQTVP